MPTIVTVTNGQVADLYYSGAQIVGVSEKEAKRFAELVRNCERPLFTAYKKREDHTLKGVKEGSLDLTIEQNQQGRSILEKILEGLVKEWRLAKELQKESPDTHYGGLSRYEEPVADISGQPMHIRYGSCRWNGHIYVSERR